MSRSIAGAMLVSETHLSDPLGPPFTLHTSSFEAIGIIVQWSIPQGTSLFSYGATPTYLVSAKGRFTGFNLRFSVASPVGNI
jgi:hypothetical protein